MTVSMVAAREEGKREEDSAAQSGESIDVAIAGGGPAGLAAALAVRAALPGVSVKVLLLVHDVAKSAEGPQVLLLVHDVAESAEVFEAASENREHGAGVLMNINGWRALQSIAPAAVPILDEKARALQSMVWHDEAGNEMRKVSPFDSEASMAEFGYAQKIASWYDIRNTLYDLLPPDTVEFCSKIQGMNAQADGSVRISVSGSADEGHAHEREINAKVLIGADGYFSRIREHTIADGPPDFTGRLTWRGRVTLPPGDGGIGDKLAEQAGSANLYIDAANFGKGRSAIIYPLQDSTYVFTANCPVSHLEQLGMTFEPFKSKSSAMSLQADDDGTDDDTGKSRCLKAMGDYPQLVLDVIQATPDPVVTEHGYYIRPADSLPDDGWCTGGITLVGDAAHLAPPDGQGLNLALEDAAVLGWHLKQEGTLSVDALRSYERERSPRVEAILSLPEINPDRQKIIIENVVHPIVDNEVAVS
eukprot:gene12053-14241_t